MRLNRKTAPGFRNCKIKPVDPAFRSVSTPRQPKDLLVLGPVYRESAAGSMRGSTSAANWEAKTAGVCPENTTLPRVEKAFVPCAARPGTRLEGTLRSVLREVA